MARNVSDCLAATKSWRPDSRGRCSALLDDGLSGFAEWHGMTIEYNQVKKAIKQNPLPILFTFLTFISLLTQSIPTDTFCFRSFLRSCYRGCCGDSDEARQARIERRIHQRTPGYRGSRGHGDLPTLVEQVVRGIPRKGTHSRGYSLIDRLNNRPTSNWIEELELIENIACAPEWGRMDERILALTQALHSEIIHTDGIAGGIGGLALMLAFVLLELTDHEEGLSAEKRRELIRSTEVGRALFQAIVTTSHVAVKIKEKSTPSNLSSRPRLGQILSAASKVFCDTLGTPHEAIKNCVQRGAHKLEELVQNLEDEAPASPDSGNFSEEERQQHGWTPIKELGDSYRHKLIKAIRLCRLGDTLSSDVEYENLEYTDLDEPERTRYKYHSFLHRDQMGTITSNLPLDYRKFKKAISRFFCGSRLGDLDIEIHMTCPIRYLADRLVDLVSRNCVKRLRENPESSEKLFLEGLSVEAGEEVLAPGWHYTRSPLWEHRQMEAST